MHYISIKQQKKNYISDKLFSFYFQSFQGLPAFHYFMQHFSVKRHRVHNNQMLPSSEAFHSYSRTSEKIF